MDINTLYTSFYYIILLLLMYTGLLYSYIMGRVFIKNCLYLAYLLNLFIFSYFTHYFALNSIELDL